MSGIFWFWREFLKFCNVCVFHVIPAKGSIYYLALSTFFEICNTYFFTISFYCSIAHFFFIMAGGMENVKQFSWKSRWIKKNHACGNRHRHDYGASLLSSSKTTIRVLLNWIIYFRIYYFRYPLNAKKKISTLSIAIALKCFCKLNKISFL